MEEVEGKREPAQSNNEDNWEWGTYRFILRKWKRRRQRAVEELETHLEEMEG